MSEMSRTYERLAEVGISESHVKRVALPDWWHDTCAQIPASKQEALIYISRAFGITLASLSDDDAELMFFYRNNSDE